MTPITEKDLAASDDLAVAISAKMSENHTTMAVALLALAKLLAHGIVHVSTDKDMADRGALEFSRMIRDMVEGHPKFGRDAAYRVH